MSRGLRLLARLRRPTSRSKRSAVSVGTAIALTIGIPSAFGRAVDANTWPVPARADVALIGSEATVGPVRTVVGELLSREGVAVNWSRPQRFRPADVLESGLAGERSLVAVWIDLSSTVEARLYFRDSSGQRFSIRHLSLHATFDQLAVEEIAQVVRSVLVALGSGSERTLSLAEARAALRENGVPAPTPLPISPSSLPVAIELRASVVGQAFAPQVPISGRIEVAVAALFGQTGRHNHGPPGRLGAWLASGYDFPTQFSANEVTVDLRTVVLRAGIIWEPWRRELLSIRLGLGGGLDWVTFHPLAEAQEVMSAPSGRFVTPMGSFAASVGVDPGRHLTLAIGAVVDLAAANVHYDFVEPDGMSTRVLVPFVVRPGITAGAGWRF